MTATSPSRHNVRPSQVVIQLQPASQLTAPLQCRLEVISLDNPPKYWALSYSWDAQTPSEPITIMTDSPQPSVLKVTANCVAAMRRLRHASEERTIWIDGICIDQTSLAERSSQVALMSDIYRVAERVVVWLGECDAATTRSIQLLTSIGDSDSIRESANVHGRVSDLKTKRRLHAAFHARARKLLSGGVSPETDELGPFFGRSWFTRMWTIQEVIFPSADNIHVHCGDATLTWLRLVAAVDCLGEIEYRWGGWQEAMHVQTYLMQTMLLFRFPAARQLTEGGPADRLWELNVSVLMVRCRDKAASDPKDKALALYGLVHELGATMLPRPDYTKSLADIYAETTAACIEYDKMLLVLCYVPSDARRPGLPSWVPDWADKGWEETDPRYPITQGQFAASGGSDPQWLVSEDRRRLTVHGKVVDTVMYCAAGSYAYHTMGDAAAALDKLVARDASGRLTISDELRTMYAVYRALKEWVEVSGWAETYPTGEGVADVVMRTLVNDEPQSLAAVERHAFADWLAAMKASEAELLGQASSGADSIMGATGGRGLLARLAIRAVSALERRAAAAERQLLGFADGEELPTELGVFLAMARRPAWAYHSQATCFSSKKRFFRTSGGFLGTAPAYIPEAIQSEDCVAVVAGMAMPVVLRPVGDGGFRLVSHCYLHGVMYGEAWERVGGRLDEIVLV
ncbi:heterokaryon incompatibility protein-domain-containing protein [Podospora conica]|nr:heterokaryon incompatibility protein-domain-containing protein [Schizothecium conicum]